MRIQRVAILGAGNGGITAAADLTLRGFEVRLFEMPQFSKNIDLLKARGGAVVLKEAAGDQRAVIPHLTTDIRQALDGAQLVLVTIPSLWVEAFAQVAAAHIRPEQVVVLHTARLHGRGALRARGARHRGADRVQHRGVQHARLRHPGLPRARRGGALAAREGVLLRGLPRPAHPELAGAAQQIYDGVVPIDNVWGTTLINGNPECHCGPCLLNAGRIEYSKGEFWLYVEGITAHTVNVLLQVGAERLALGAAMGYQLDDGTTARIKRGYLLPGPEPVHVKYNTSPVFSKIKGPSSLDSRYFIEDISNGLVLYSSLGRALGVPTPASDAIVTLGGILLQRDFTAEGITLDKLGFAGMGESNSSRR